MECEGGGMSHKKGEGRGHEGGGDDTKRDEKGRRGMEGHRRRRSGREEAIEKKVEWLIEENN